MVKLSHFNKKGESNMVDISDKKNTIRTAKAEGTILVDNKTFDHIDNGNVQKGNIFEVARIAGIMGTKNTHTVVCL